MGLIQEVRVFNGKDAKWAESDANSFIGMFREYFIPWMNTINTNASVAGQHEIRIDEDWNQMPPQTGSSFDNFMNLWVNAAGATRTDAWLAVQLRWRESSDSWEFRDFGGTSFSGKTAEDPYGYAFGSLFQGFGVTDTDPTMDNTGITYQFVSDDTDGQEFFSFAFTYSASTSYTGGILFIRTVDGNWIVRNGTRDQTDTAIAKSSCCGYDPNVSSWQANWLQSEVDQGPYSQQLSFYRSNPSNSTTVARRNSLMAANKYLFLPSSQLNRNPVATSWDLNIDGTFRGPYFIYLTESIMVLWDPRSLMPPAGV